MSKFISLPPWLEPSQYTFTNAGLPSVTLDSLKAVKEDVERKHLLASVLSGMDVVESPLLPEGYSAMVGCNSFAVITPDGRIIKAVRKDAFSEWEVKA
jgi:hypothetical protein